MLTDLRTNYYPIPKKAGEIWDGTILKEQISLTTDTLKLLFFISIVIKLFGLTGYFYFLLFR
jgi:hypothetical protein